MASGYDIEVLDGTSQKTSKSVTSPSTISFTSLQFNDMKQGYRYNVSIVAKSQVYDGNNTVNGDTYTGEVKTVVKSKMCFYFRKCNNQCAHRVLYGDRQSQQLRRRQ